MVSRNIVVRTALKLYRFFGRLVMLVQGKFQELFEMILDRLVIWLCRHYQPRDMYC